VDNTNNLKESWNRRSADAKTRALKAIEALMREKEPVNFNSVHLRSGVSKNYLYNNEELRKGIEECRAEEQAREKAWHSKYDKTSKSKEVIIETKDKHIAKLEAENRRLRKEINQLRAMIYETK